jgi:hypothetical protein
MSTQYRLVQSGKTASGGCSAGRRIVRAVVVVEWLTLLLLVWEVLGSNLGPETGYLD